MEISERDYHNKNVVKNLTCQILGKELPKFLVIGSHIFKHEWAKQVQKLLGFNNINDPRNGFLLFQPIEKAFDSSRLCFIYNSEKKDFCLKILDPSLKNESILSSCKTFISAKLCGEWGSSVDEVIDIVGASLTENGKEVTFGDLEGRPLIYKGATRPYKRCLNFHASRAREQAIKMNWISENVKFKYQWSENFEDGKKMEDFLSGLRLTTSFEDPNAIFASLDDDEVLDDITPGDAIDERYDHEEGDDDAIVDEYDSNDV